MKIVVCAKQVPNTTQVKLDPVKNTLIRDGVPSIINHEDKHAIEQALRLREEIGGTVTVISMGPPQADVALREALAMGCDEAILVTSRAFAGADTLATSYTLSNAIKKVGDADVIFCGRQAIDGDTAQVGSQIAEWLGMPQVSYVQGVEFKGDKVIVNRKLEDGHEMIEAKLPCILTAIKELNEVRYPSIPGIFSAYGEKTVTIWTEKDFPDADVTRMGFDGSPTKVRKVFSPDPKGKGEVLTGAPKELAEALVKRLEAKKIL